MIHVKWELEGNEIDEAAAQAAVQRILNYYKRALASVSCPAHGGQPWLSVRGRTVKSLTVSVGSCCSALKSQMDEQIRRVSRRDDG